MDPWRFESVTQRFTQRRLSRRRALQAGAASLALATMSRSPYPSAARVATPGPAFGDAAGLVDIGGHSLWIEDRGAGGPTVIFEAGAGNNAQVWDAIALPPGTASPAVLPGVAAFTRVCAYDRPGTRIGPGPEYSGRSDPVPQPRTTADKVADLHALLAVADVPGPYVLVGHSYGGLIMRLYASTYPDQVAGLVLVDAAHEDYYAAAQALLTPEQWAAWLAPLPEYADDATVERNDVIASSEQMRAAAVASPLRPMPLVVLTRGRPLEWPADFPSDALEAAWRPRQDELAALAPDARLIVAEQSGHYIQLDQPALVIEAVRQVVDAVREPSSWAVSTPVASSGEAAGLVDIGGRSLFLERRGAGGPTVVLEAGAGNNAQIWDDIALPSGTPSAAVLPSIAAFTHVCAYDRPNTFLDPDHASRSDPVSHQRSAADMVADLHALLTAADVPGPYVLVGHSYGGFIVRLFAMLYPGEVAGLVLIDAAHEDWWVALDSALTPEQREVLYAEPAEFPGLERIDTAASAEQMREAAATSPLQPLPLVVLTHGVPWDWPTGYPVEAIEAIWAPLQDELAELVPDARLIVAEQSQHYIQLTEPELVIEAIRQVVNAVREPDTWATPTAIGNDEAAIHAGRIRS